MWSCFIGDLNTSSPADVSGHNSWYSTGSSVGAAGAEKEKLGLEMWKTQLGLGCMRTWTQTSLLLNSTLFHSFSSKVIATSMIHGKGNLEIQNKFISF